MTLTYTTILIAAVMIGTLTIWNFYRIWKETEHDKKIRLAKIYGIIAAITVIFILSFTVGHLGVKLGLQKQINIESTQSFPDAFNP